LDRGFFSILSVEIEDQQQVGDQTGQELKQNAVPVSGDEMIPIEVSFPPGEDGFNLPAQREDEGDLRIKSAVILIASIHHAGLADFQKQRHKRTFCGLALGQTFGERITGGCLEQVLSGSEPLYVIIHQGSDLEVERERKRPIAP
jgi:hypothetical protein